MPAWPVFVGYFMVFLGVLWAVWPEILRGWLVSRASWMIFWALVSLFFTPLASYAKQWTMNGWICAVITVLVAGSLLKTLLGKAAQKIPLLFFRLAGALAILAGLYFILFSGKKL